MLRCWLFLFFWLLFCSLIWLLPLLSTFSYSVGQNKIEPTPNLKLIRYVITRKYKIEIRHNVVVESTMLEPGRIS